MPHRIQNIIKEFPKLNIALMHGAWPWAAAITGLAFAYTNIFIIPDIYMIHGPDWRDYVDAANYIAQDNICYGLFASTPSIFKLKARTAFSPMTFGSTSSRIPADL